MQKKIASGYQLVFGYLGIFLSAIGIITMLPLILYAFIPFLSYSVKLVDGSSITIDASTNLNYWHAFVIPGLSAIIVGLILYFVFLFKKERANLGRHQDSILIVLVWVFSILVGAVPFLFRDMDFVQSVFESVSGYSAAGLSVFDLQESLPGYQIYCLYRSIMQLFGGTGLVLILASAISDRYGMRLYYADGHNDKLIPNLAKSSRLILSIYCGYIIIGIIALVFCGMPVFDSINNSIAALSTGGFSVHPLNIGYYEAAGVGNGVAIETVLIVLMVLGATNFVIHMFLLRAKFKKVFKDSETRFLGILCVVFIPLLVFSVLMNYQNNSCDLWMAFRYGTFQFFSAVTTTGFSNVTTTQFTAVFATSSLFLLALVMCIGGGVGSTAGGIKQYRFVLACKGLYWQIKSKLSSKRFVYPHYAYRYGENREISQEDTTEAASYTILYLIVFALGTVFICLFSSDITLNQAIFEFSSALSGTGLSVGVTNPTQNYGVIWVLICGMFLGRLEILPVYFASYRVGKDIMKRDTI